MEKVGVFFCLLTLITMISCSSSSISISGKPLHHTTEGFRNYPPVPTASSKGFLFYLRRIFTSIFLAKAPSGHSLSEKEAIARLNALKGKNTLTWLGHSTFLLRIDGKTILTDPFLTTWASPTPVGGPRRFVAPGIKIKNLPSIDIIIVSHNHYDHLDTDTISVLPGKAKIHVGVPLGLKKIFVKHGYKNVHELDWGGSAKIDNIQITSLPAVHDSGRGLGDKNKSLWCSWAIVSSSGKYFFGGDTGYSPILFRNIGLRFKLFDLAILPIGAYAPRELMWMSHVNPEEAIRIGLDINTKVFVAGHWGTIQLSDEPIMEPPERFRKEANLAGIVQEKIWVLKIGESRVLP